MMRWYNATEGFGFVAPDVGGEEFFLHRSTFEKAGLSEIREGTRVRVRVPESEKGPQVCTLQLA